MKRRDACFALSVALLWTSVSAEQALPQLTDWHSDRKLAASDRPVVLFFTLPGCRFCAQVRQNYMLSLERRGEIVREVVIDSDRPVTGFPGAATQRAVAKKFGARVAPVVLLVDGRGRKLADSIVGGDIAGLYGGYLDNAFEAAESAIRKSSPPTAEHN